VVEVYMLFDELGLVIGTAQTAHDYFEQLGTQDHSDGIETDDVETFIILGRIVFFQKGKAIPE